MSRDEVVIRMKKLDVLYKELDILDSKVKSKEIKEIDFFIQEQIIKEQIDKLFEV